MPKSAPWERMIAELLVIGAGVFLGLLADDYRGQRDDRRAEQGYLRLLDRDLESDSAALEEGLWLSAQADGARLLRRHRGSALVAPDSVNHAITALSLSSNYEQVRPTFLSLRDMGGLALISDDALRADLVDYYEVWQARLQSWLATHQYWQRELRIALGPHIEAFPPEKFDDFIIDPLPDDFVVLRSSWDIFVNDGPVWSYVTEVGVRAAEIRGLALEMQEFNRELRSSIREAIE